MATVPRDEITAYCEAHIQEFHERRLTALEELKLAKLLKQKNPYLFKAKNVLTAPELVKLVLDAHLSSQEESIFGGFLEGLAIFLCEKAYGGHKSAAEGIDLEFARDGIKYIVTIKSGPNWGNSSQIGRMKDNFIRAKRTLRTNRSTVTEIIAVNGCCYGRNERPDRGDYFKYCGQRFWEFISGDANLYIDIIEPLGHRAKEHNEVFMVEYAKAINRFTHLFTTHFCDEDGSIRWADIVTLNSGLGKQVWPRV